MCGKDKIDLGGSGWVLVRRGSIAIQSALLFAIQIGDLQCAC